MSKTLGSLPVGALVKDTASKYYGVPIVWQVADQNHDGYPDNSTTLITERIIKIAGFDGAEADNADSNRKSSGNNRYRSSNLRQWLNSTGAAGSWWIAQNLTGGTANTNNHDAPPTAANMNQPGATPVDERNEYNSEAGFMTNLSSGFRVALLSTTLTVQKNNKTDGGGSETVIDKIFLASVAEVGLSYNYNIAEGSQLAIFKGNNAWLCNPTAEAIANNTYGPFTTESPCYWWLRSPNAAFTSSCALVGSEASNPTGGSSAYYGVHGVRPLCNLSSDILVSDEPDSDGAYVLEFGTVTLNDMDVGDTVKINENGEPVNYMIVHKGLPSDMYDSSCDGVWLLREQAHSEMSWKTNGMGDYENSDIHAWLNSTFLNTVDEKIRAAIKTVKIPYVKGPGKSGAGVQSGSNGLPCKVFLLGGYEVGFTATDNQYLPIDSAKLSYFLNGNTDAGAKTKRICNDSSGSAVDWWLRSPSTRNDGYVHNVGEDGHCNDYIDSATRAARPAFILPADLKVDSDGSIVTNAAPTITSDTASGSDLGEISEPINFTYTVNDEDGDPATVTEYLDDVQTRTYTVTLGAENSFEVLSDPVLFQKILNGEHTLKIVANDGTNDSLPYTVTFDKQVRTAEISLVEPLPANDVIKAAVISVTGNIPQDAAIEVLVTNNALDENPVWEDMTQDYLKKINHVFDNQTAANGFAFNFKVTATRGESGEQGYISNIGGAFE